MKNVILSLVRVSVVLFDASKTPFPSDLKTLTSVSHAFDTDRYLTGM
jgi:hypothetical protein